MTTKHTQLTAGPVIYGNKVAERFNQTPLACGAFGDVREQHDAGVRHGEGQSQDAAAHYGIAQVENRHPEGGVSRMLQENNNNKNKHMRKQT